MGLAQLPIRAVARCLGPSGRGNREVEPPPIRFRNRENRWDVFQPDGRYLGRITASRLFRPYVMKGNTVWGVMLDEDDVPTIVKMRITPEF